MTVSSGALLGDLQGRIRRLEDDLREQVGRLPELSARLESDYALAQKTERTAEPWTSWLDAQASQAAVSWVLGCVFVRFCEDNNLTDKRWIAGLADAFGDGLARAVDAQAAWTQANPRENERGWLREAFGWLRSTHAGSSLFPDTDFVWWWDISADAATDLLGFFRRRGPEGGLVHRFDSPDWDTRFLGDLYQDLSEAARKRYALLQTPEFVEEFILDLTLDPALDRFGLDGFRMIDPACGSGHFLLGAFHRILAAWTEQQPGMEIRQRVQRALDSVHGVDINVAATAIAKFRLTVAALRAAQASGLDSPDAPAFKLNLATGDSLIWGSGGRQTHTDIIGNELTLDEHRYVWEDIDQHPGILKAGSYHVVLANPPYITVRDKALNQAYRDRYQTCSGKYAMSVPFAELLFQLAVRDQETPGIVGQITANSFMKREFGKKLIEEYLPTVELTHVIDTSGAYIPGHGTPTVILIGNRRYPKTQTLRAVLGIRGEPSAPVEPSKGHVWRSIVELVKTPSTQNEYVSVADIPRDSIAAHPWSLAGGGVAELKDVIDGSSVSTPGHVAFRIGVFGIMGSDDAMTIPVELLRRSGLEKKAFRHLVVGDEVRDFCIEPGDVAFFPYDTAHRLQPLESFPMTARRLWVTRTELGNRATFAKSTYFLESRPWYEWHQLPKDKGAHHWAITWGEVATHNHFALNRSGKVFKQTAPVIKLPDGASEDDHLRLLGLLNSSTASFWLKQVCHSKGVGGIGGGIGDEEWEPRFAFNATKVGRIPLPYGAPLERARRLDALAQELATVTPKAVADAGVQTREALAEARVRWESVRAEMISLQEELDWEVYRLYGVLDDELTYNGSDLPGLALGERAFEIVLARKLKAGEVETEWFTRHRSTPITEIPEHWPQAYRDLVARRIEIIESHPLLHLIERPECKRRWATRPWEDMQRDALINWILDRLETPELWRDQHGPRVLSIAQLADLLRADTDLRNVLTLLTGRPDHDLTTELARLLKDEAVPFLAAHRHTESGMRKRAAWEHTWDLQRREDAGEDVGDIPVPPKYQQADFRNSYWRHRGKLDVPKERFIGYPGAGRDADKTPIIGWAGWDHLHQAQALARLILDRSQQDGWQADRLTPLLAGLAELEPWLHQWHNQLDPLYGGSPAAFYTTFLDEQLQRHNLTRQTLTDWRPTTTTRRGRPRSLT